MIRKTVRVPVETLFEDIPSRHIAKSKVGSISCGIATLRHGEGTVTEYSIDGKMDDEIASEIVTELLQKYTITLDHSVMPLQIKSKRR